VVGTGDRLGQDHPDEEAPRARRQPPLHRHIVFEIGSRDQPGQQDRRTEQPNQQPQGRVGAAATQPVQGGGDEGQQ